jgi:EmrB/QacA subfamily drug resistance transporter
VPPMLERKWWTLIAVCVAIFMLLIDVTIVNVALPSIQSSLKASFTDLQWVIDAYALTLAAAVLNAGSLADLLGRRRVFAAGLAIFTVSSLLCGIAPGPLFLILARAAQGVGGAIMFACSLALLSQEFHGRERGTAFGIWGATTGAAVAVGPLVGGLLTEKLDWRWIFLVNVPIGVAALAVTFLRLRETRDEEHGGVDLIGLATLSAGLFCLVFGLLRGNDKGWSSGAIVGTLAGAAALLGAFLLSQWRGARPMLDLRLFRRPAFVGAQVAALAISSGPFAVFLFLTLYLQDVLGYSPLQTGVRFLPITLLSFACAPLAGKLSAVVPVRLLIGGGLALCTLALLLMHGLSTGSGWHDLLPGFIVLGAGIGFVTAPLASAAVGVVAPRQAGMASGINSTFRQVGIATGIAALGALFQAKLGTTPFAGRPRTPQAALHLRADFVSGLNELFLVCAGVTAVGAVLAFALLRRRDFLRPGEDY